MRVDGYPYQRNGLGERNSVKVGISTILQRSPAFLGSRATLKVPWEWDPKYNWILVSSPQAPQNTTAWKTTRATEFCHRYSES